LRSFCSLMRAICSMTATVEAVSGVPFGLVNSVPSAPVSTRPLASEARSILVGRFAGSISMAGAIELPPESEFCEPISVSSSPRAPAFAMPYIGLCGLLPVSFSERAAMTQPLTPARVVGVVFSSMPRRNALSEWNIKPNSSLMKSAVALFGSIVPGRPSFE
jgi:hypothetical protein